MSGSVPPPSGDWWRSAVIYQVYPRSFADSDGDGIGDLAGITARLGHLEKLGVDAIWLSPFLRSPQKDHGYDVADYRDVDPLFGSLDDFDTLIRNAHARGIRIVMDIIPNHSSDQHPMFTAALAGGPEAPERRHFIFRDGRGTGGASPPNDWVHGLGGSPWERVVEPDGRPGQWYLHIFDVSQPDWDWNDAWVRSEFRSILRFWLERGVDGFRIDVAHGLVKADGLPDWPHRVTEALIPTSDPATRPPYWDQDAVHEIYRDWRSLLEEFGPDRILVAEAYLPSDRLARYVRPDEMHQAFNFGFALVPWRARDIRRVVEESLARDGAVGAPTTWVLSNHDLIRHATRLGYPAETKLPYGLGRDDPRPDAALGLRRARAFSAFMLALPGSAYLYQGEELGLPEAIELPDEVREDYIWFITQGRDRGRDGCRVPLPWEMHGPTLGFGPGERSWLPQPDDWSALSVEAQDGDEASTLALYRAAVRGRRELGLDRGFPEWLGDLPEGVVGFRSTGVAVLANTTPDDSSIRLGVPSRIVLESVPGAALVDGIDVVVRAEATVWLGGLDGE